jgi:NAD-dependent SIR2 family protein deacetylase
MKCIECGGLTHVLETRGTIRRRECLVCKARFKTEEVVMAEPERKAPAPKKFKSPNISVAKEKMVARKKARDEIERRKWDRESDSWWNEDNNYLPDRW